MRFRVNDSWSCISGPESIQPLEGLRLWVRLELGRALCRGAGGAMLRTEQGLKCMLFALFSEGRGETGGEV